MPKKKGKKLLLWLLQRSDSFRRGRRKGHGEESTKSQSDPLPKEVTINYTKIQT